MPKIVVRGIEKEDLKKVSGLLFDTISEIINRPKAAFTLDLLQSVAISEGEEISRVRVDINWVERPQEVCEQVAKAVNDIIQPLGYKHVSIGFNAIDLKKEFDFIVVE